MHTEKNIATKYGVRNIYIEMYTKQTTSPDSFITRRTGKIAKVNSIVHKLDLIDKYTTSNSMLCKQYTIFQADCELGHEARFPKHLKHVYRPCFFPKKKKKKEIID